MLAITSDIIPFLRLQQGIELLLSLTQDDEALPQVFDLLCAFALAAHRDDIDPLPAFQLRLLALLGILPSSPDDPRYHRLPPDAQTVIRACRHIQNFEQLCQLFNAAHVSPLFIASVLEEQLDRPLKSASMSW